MRIAGGDGAVADLVAARALDGDAVLPDSAFGMDAPGAHVDGEVQQAVAGRREIVSDLGQRLDHAILQQDPVVTALPNVNVKSLRMLPK